MMGNPLIKMLHSYKPKPKRQKVERRLRRGEIVLREQDVKILWKVIGRGIALLFLLPSYFLIIHFFNVNDLMTGLIISIFYLVAVIGFLLWLYYKVVLVSTKRRH